MAGRNERSSSSTLEWQLGFESWCMVATVTRLLLFSYFQFGTRGVACALYLDFLCPWFSPAKLVALRRETCRDLVSWRVDRIRTLIFFFFLYCTGTSSRLKEIKIPSEWESITYKIFLLILYIPEF